MSFLSSLFPFQYPTPEEVLRIGPPRSLLKTSSPTEKNKIPEEEEKHLERRKRLEERVLSEVAAQLRSGRHLGTAVCVYQHGRLVLHIVAGVFRSPSERNEAASWKPVDENTLFMSYSVAKGVTAMGLLSLVDDELLSYDDRVVDLWPEFGSAPGKQDITVGEAVSHRAGLGSVLPFNLDVLLSTLRGHVSRDWKESWAAGERFVENMAPEFAVGAFARYHYVSFSWIIGGIMQRAVQKCKKGVWESLDSATAVSCSVSEIVQRTVGRCCGCMEDVHIGLLPSSLLHRVALLEPMRPHLLQHPNPMSEFQVVELYVSPYLSPLPRVLKRAVLYLCYLVLCVLATLEAILFCAVGNCAVWRGICLPSSNGFFTAQSVAVMYAALANRGEVEGGDGSRVRVFRESTLEALFREASDPSRAVPMFASHSDRESWGRLSKGFSPWPLPTLHGREHMRLTLGHQGMGGCSSYGCAETGLAVCIMRNVYDPLLVSEGAVKLDDGTLSKIIREELIKLNSP